MAVIKKAKVDSKKTDYLSNVADDKKFWLCDGGVISNLVQLRDALKDMNDGVFGYHVNNDRNDFANWIKDVVGDKKLAGALRTAKTKKDTFQKISAAIRNYAKK